MDQQSEGSTKGSTTVCHDQDTQHVEEAKENVTEGENLNMHLIETDHLSASSITEFEDQETQHVEVEEAKPTANLNIHEEISNMNRQSTSDLIECQDQGIQHKGEENDDGVNLEQQNSNTDRHSTDGGMIENRDQEIQLSTFKDSINTAPGVSLRILQSYTAQQSKSYPIPCTNKETDYPTAELKKSLVESTSRLEMLKEIAIKSIDLNVPTCSTVSSLRKEYDPTLPLIIINRSPANRSPITTQPSRTFLAIQPSISPKSLLTPLPNQPQSLFLQALTKLNESSLSLGILNRNLKSEPTETENPNGTTLKSPELTPPDSLTSAPPSYSFVLRQSAARRRPRLMGTFIPSPSFVTKTPPPNYAAAFDIYVDSPLPPQPARIYHFGFSAMPIICPECGYVGLTAVTSKITLCTHLCALLLCLFCCWVCVPLPYMMSSCKDVYHYCRNCRNFLGMYSPSNPETPYPV